MYETFEHTADLGLRVRAATEEVLFADAARGLFSMIVPELASVKPTQSREFQISGRERDYLLFDWLNLRGIFEFLKVSHDQNQTRYAIGAEPFINRVLQPRIQYRINNGPGNKPETNRDELVFELHMFF